MYLSRKSLADRLDLAEGAIDQLVKRGIIPAPIALGEYLRWSWDDVDRQIVQINSGEMVETHTPYAPRPSYRLDPMRSLISLASDPDRLAKRCVYFIAAGDLIKIGFSNSVATRMRDLQSASASELKLIGIIPGATITEEQRLHEHFAEYRKHGEWFALPDGWQGQIAHFEVVS